MWQWMIHYTTVMFDIVHWGVFDIHSISGVCWTPVFRWLVVIAVTDFFIGFVFEISISDRDHTWAVPLVYWLMYKVSIQIAQSFNGVGGCGDDALHVYLWGTQLILAGLPPILRFIMVFLNPSSECW